MSAAGQVELRVWACLPLEELAEGAAVLPTVCGAWLDGCRDALVTACDMAAELVAETTAEIAAGLATEVTGCLVGCRDASLSA
jgi:hypothetical protein